jgi:hypothetical protein
MAVAIAVLGRPGVAHLEARLDKVATAIASTASEIATNTSVGLEDGLIVGTIVVREIQTCVDSGL